MSQSSALVARIIAEDAIAMEQLRAVRSLDLPDWCIAAGFVRNRVWDHLHGIVPARAPVDIDVIYFDASDLSTEREAGFEARLQALAPLPWQVRNQARMHVVKKDYPQHRDTAHAMTFWLETVTPVGVRLGKDDTLTLVAPLGTDDLLNLRCRPTEFGRLRRAEYDERIAAKCWRELWPRVEFVD